MSLLPDTEVDRLRVVHALIFTAAVTAGRSDGRIARHLCKLPLARAYAVRADLAGTRPLRVFHGGSRELTAQPSPTPVAKWIAPRGAPLSLT